MRTASAPGVAARPRQDPVLLALVVLGGSAGTAARALAEGAFPAMPAGWPWATFVINVTGAFLLGFLLEALCRGGRDEGWRRRVRLGAGTGFLGGYTTYSTFALEVAQRAPALAAAYAAATALLGVAAAIAGYRLAGRLAPGSHGGASRGDASHRSVRPAEEGGTT